MAIDLRQGGRYDEIWRGSEPYMRARKNDVHIPLSYAYALRLLDIYPDADRDIVIIATILHDIGWWSIDINDIIERGFGPNMMQSDVRFLHESEGVRLGRELLEKLGWPAATIQAVCEIIDGHDTRPHPKSLNDRLMRDSDKLWRFTVTGISVACDWFKMNPGQYARRQATKFDLFETEAGRVMAEEELPRTCAALMIDLI